jgi:hypothetical protein
MLLNILDNFYVRPSTRKNKKYDVFEDDKYLLSFGDKRYQQYYDKIGFYSHLNHLDNERKKRYYARHGKTNNKKSAKYWSNKYLW